jgi:hypothetical protein
LTAAAAALVLTVSGSGASSELAAPFRVEANGKPIDMEAGNAAPCVIDFDRDGALDLLVGQRGECNLRIFRNRGSRTDPKFGVSAMFRAGGEVATLPGG